MNDKELEQEIKTSILFDGTCGVKILWTPQGGGKSTMVREVVSNLHRKNSIAGVCVIYPQDNKSSIPSLWFRSALFS